ncbi:MAG: membrane protein insertase YidC [Methylacidiphilales bacterium]|nr:membrane protein insertase YidC [Candidatus Methylacidiphilales bacterium]
MKHNYRETLRIFLYLIVGIHFYALYQAWEADNQPVAKNNVASKSATLPDQIVPIKDSPQLPVQSPKDTPSANQIEAPIFSSTPSIKTTSASLVETSTDGFTAKLSSVGGDIQAIVLSSYFNANNTNYEILGNSEQEYLMLQSGFTTNGDQTMLPELTSDYRLIEKSRGDVSVITFAWSNDQITVLKSYSFYKSSFEVDLALTVITSDKLKNNIDIFPFVQQVATPRTKPIFSSSYLGAATFNEEQGYKKLSYSTLQEGSYKATLKDSWFAFVDHYFVSAWIPPKDQATDYYSRASANKGKVILGGFLPGKNIGPASKETWHSKFYFGPKSSKKLEKTTPTLSKVIDYGILSFLSKPMFWLLEFFHENVGNWGWAIVLLTFVIRAILYYPAEIAFVSMANIKKVQPEMLALKERHADDRQKLGIEMMRLYKENKINPLSGCLPVLLQIPVFIALFWMLSESVEMKYSPWILWIKDLSEADPFYVLPVLMTMSMIVQQKLTAQPADPLQQKIFSMLPLVFGAMSIIFPSGLVLYWVVNNILSVLQQLVIEYRLKLKEDRAH